MQRAKRIAIEINIERKRLGDGTLDQGSGRTKSGHSQDILNINDYPQIARAKVTQAGRGLELVHERYGVNVLSKGIYRLPGKRVGPGEEASLHLVIEGASRHVVQQAKTEIIRMLDDETRKLGIIPSHQQAQGGRYSVI